jgi:hypothetical protein
MGLRPQTLFGIADSPVGLAAYFLDHDARSYELIARVFAGTPRIAPMESVGFSPGPSLRCGHSTSFSTPFSPQEHEPRKLRPESGFFSPRRPLAEAPTNELAYNPVFRESSVLCDAIPVF